jgi:hypothetical protein
MSGNPSVPPNNVVPMPTNWPGPSFNPGGRSWPSPPSCFSELAAMNACYDSVQMMEQILAKVMTDLVTNNTAVQQAIVEAIAASGSNVPLIGVTNGSDAQPGQVGEWFFQQQNITVTGVQSQTTMVSVTLQPGDWDFWAEMAVGVFVNDVQFVLSPAPAGVSDNQQAILATAPGTVEAIWLVGPTSRLSSSVPVLLPYQVMFNTLAAASAGGATMIFKARRRR